MPAETTIDLTFDIEVAGLEWEEIDELTRGYLLERARDEQEKAAVPERTALFPGLGKVIAIGMWNLNTEQGGLLLEGPPTNGHITYERIAGCKLFRGSEADIIREFWRIINPHERGARKRLVSFNGRQYDMPVLAIRSAMLGIKPSRSIDTKPWERDSHVDLMDVLTFNGGLRERYKLDYWCRRFDIESPKTKLDGSQVQRAYREKRIEDIGEYCVRDTRATGELFKKIRPTLIDL
ncbi:MAG: ribonuclease H-like domain-containing protein [Planctomycetes bacterium]|nr:ribonuclease H-like domain-containing protein [Planctomycetota bacterium]